MKKIFSLGLMLVALTLMNCSKEEIATEAPAVNGAAFELFAATEDGRTVNDIWSTLWAEGDQITVIHAENGTQDWVQDTPTDKPFTIDNVATGRFTGTLQAELVAESYDWYLFYPYNDYIAQPIDLTAGYTYIGSRSDRSQAQTGINNLTHIAGSNYPLYGKVTNVAVGEIPSVTMHNVSSLVEFAVKNTESEAIAISEIQFTSTEDIVGSYFIDFGGDQLGFTPSRTDYVSSTAKLSITDATIEAGATAKFYMAVKPHTVTAGDLTIKVTTDAGACTKTLEGVTTTFKAGKVKTISFNYEAPAPAEAETWTRITSVNDMTDGKYVIMIKHTDGSIGYLPAVATSSNPAFTTQSIFDGVTETYSVSVPEEMIWYFEKNSNSNWGITTADGKHLNNELSKAQGIRVSDVAHEWIAAAHSKNAEAIALKEKTTGRYLGVYSTDWRGYTSDSANEYKTNGLHSQLILYYCGTLTEKTQLKKPTITTATAEGNTITVSWLEVANAGSYEVTCGEEEPQTITDALTCTFTDLEYETPYQISVVAKPADTSAYKASEAAMTSVTTEADPNPVVPGTEAVVYEATFNNSGEYRSSGNNSYTVTEKKYLVSKVLWHLVYTDCVTSGGPLNGIANIMARVAKNTTNSPYVYTDNLLTTSKEITKVTFMSKMGANVTLKVLYSTDGSNWKDLSYAKDPTIHSTLGYTATVSGVTTSDFRLKFQWSVTSSTGSNRDSQLDNVTVYGK